jgi:hypothetical protein
MLHEEEDTGRWPATCGFPKATATGAKQFKLLGLGVVTEVGGTVAKRNTQKSVGEENVSAVEPQAIKQRAARAPVTPPAQVSYHCRLHLLCLQKFALAVSLAA